MTEKKLYKTLLKIINLFNLNYLNKNELAFFVEYLSYKCDKLNFERSEVYFGSESFFNLYEGIDYLISEDNYEQSLVIDLCKNFTNLNLNIDNLISSNLLNKMSTLLKLKIFDESEFDLLFDLLKFIKNFNEMYPNMQIQ